MLYSVLEGFLARFVLVYFVLFCIPWFLACLYVFAERLGLRMLGAEKQERKFSQISSNFLLSVI